MLQRVGRQDEQIGDLALRVKPQRVWNGRGGQPGLWPDGRHCRAPDGEGVRLAGQKRKMGLRRKQTGRIGKPGLQGGIRVAAPFVTMRDTAQQAADCGPANTPRPAVLPEKSSAPAANAPRRCA